MIGWYVLCVVAGAAAGLFKFLGNIAMAAMLWGAWRIASHKGAPAWLANVPRGHVGFGLVVSFLAGFGLVMILLATPVAN